MENVFLAAVVIAAVLYLWRFFRKAAGKDKCADCASGNACSSKRS